MSGEVDAIALSADDTVATVLRAVSRGETVRIRCGERVETIVAAEDVALCHKIGLRPHDIGALVRKYGEVIGEATARIGVGSHVHVHNMRSRRGRHGG